MPQTSAPTRPIDDLDRDILTLSRRIDQTTYRLLVLVREFDERRGWLHWGSTGCAEWLAWRCDLSPGAARERVRIAHALLALPRISAAFAAGTLSYSKVRALTRVATVANEAGLLELALATTAARLEERCAQLRNARPGATAAANRAHAARGLRSWEDRERGVTVITVELPSEQGALVLKALDRGVALGCCESGPEFGPVSFAAQRADALVAVASGYLQGEAPGVAGETAVGDVSAETSATAVAGCAAATAAAPAAAGAVPAASENRPSPLPRSSADRYQVMVHVDAAALAGGTGGADLALESVRRLLCDGALVGLGEDAAGEVLQVGRRQRTVPTALRRALWARDRGCAWPGCRHTRFLDAHHVRHWCNGGETSPGNTLLLCDRHHRLVHEGGYAVVTDAGGRRRFLRPDGRAVPECGYCVADTVDPTAAGDGTAEVEAVDAADISAEMRSAAVARSARVAAQACAQTGVPLVDGTGEGTARISAETPPSVVEGTAEGASASVAPARATVPGDTVAPTAGDVALSRRRPRVEEPAARYAVG